MLIMDLRLPDGRILQNGTDRIIPESEASHPVLEWEGISGLSGSGSQNAWHPETRQPYWGCPTGGDIVAEVLMLQLARQYLPRRKDSDDDARWALLEG